MNLEKIILEVLTKSLIKLTSSFCRLNYYDNLELIVLALQLELHTMKY